VLYGPAGIGKSTLARQIAERVRPLAAVTLVDDFDPGARDFETLLGAPGKLLVTCQLRFETASPAVLFRRVGPLTWSGADELAQSLPNLRTLSDAERDRAWRLTAGHPGALVQLDARLRLADFAQVSAQLSAVVTAVTGWPVTSIEPTELPAHAAEVIAATAAALLREPTPETPAPAIETPATHHQPEPEPPTLRSSAWRDLLLATVTALATAAVAFGALRPSLPVPALLRTSLTPPPASAPQQPSAQAAAWLASQLAPNTPVACDPATCATLRFPVARDPQAASIVIATPQLRATEGTSLDAVAPTILASFGTGASRVDVRLVAPPAAFAADHAARKQAGTQLLRNPRLHASPWVASQLAAGQVDARLLMALAALTADQPVSIADLSDTGPGADPGVPLRAALIMVADEPAAWAFLAGQQTGAFRLAELRVVGNMLYLRFSAPCPLGLLTSQP
jgi:hypothetical protein